MDREKLRRRRKSTYIKAWVIAVLSVCALAGMLWGGITYAKYYAQESRKGVALASGLYFTSNCMQSISDNNLGNYDLFTEYVDSNWTGVGAASIAVQVNNFENILLYNDQNLNITYDLYFRLIDTPVEGSSYVVQYTDEANTVKNETLKQNETFVIKDQYLKGGSAKYNRVTLIITPESGFDIDTYVSKRVAVWAIPTYPDYVADANRLAAVVVAVPQKGAFSHQEGFDIAGDLNSLQDAGTWNPKGIQLLEDYSGFVYNIKTTGEDRGVRHYFEITWKNEVLDIDRYNTYYLKAQAEHTAAKPTIWTNTDEKTTTIKIEALSYASMDIHFYKAAGFKASDFGSADEFHRLVTVKDVQVVTTP